MTTSSPHRAPSGCPLHGATADQLPPSAPPPREPLPLYGAEFERDPLAYYTKLREYGPVVPVKVNESGTFWQWMVLDPDLARDVAQNRQGWFSNDPRTWARREEVQENHPLLRLLDPRGHMQCHDGAEHARRRRPVVEAFADLEQHSLQTRRFITALADKLIAGFAHKGEADIEIDFAHRLPLLVMMGLLGIDARYAEEVEASVHEVIRVTPQAHDGSRRLDSIFRRVVVEKLKDPGPDLTSRMLKAAGGKRREINEVESQSWFMMNASLTTAAWMSNTVLEILTDTELRAQIRDARVSVGDVANRGLWQAPPLQNVFNRWALKDVELGGCQIKRGDMIVLSLAASGSRTRPDDPFSAVGHQAYLAWGAGSHACPAQDLACHIVYIGLERLFLHLPGMELTVPVDQVEWAPALVVRGPASLPVHFSPVHDLDRGVSAEWPQQPLYFAEHPHYDSAASGTAANDRSSRSNSLRSFVRGRSPRTPRGGR
ncbi:cytochrome P450 (plasmid) [Actinacidiphila glaucinigra]|uniref:hypothetical protein n=1 Tax=Actinacidiphila glaucinigra TaxID=235986 RepID=UPI002DD87D84|nr:hypothetical protein [Actinacidiphila glaucinigra]WSD65898.1 cytochrome P450 [Actinacidiphila glaucinigra]